MNPALICLWLAMVASPMACSGGGFLALQTFSPKLNQLLTSNCQASNVLFRVWSAAFSKKNVQLYYFYSIDERIPRAAHQYFANGDLTLTVRENQEPADQLMCILYETINSQRDKDYELARTEAKNGKLRKKHYTEAILKLEFRASELMNKIVPQLALDSAQIDGSYYYSRFLNCPTNFEDFPSYARKVSAGHRNPIAECEKEYEYLRKQ